MSTIFHHKSQTNNASACSNRSLGRGFSRRLLPGDLLRLRVPVVSPALRVLCSGPASRQQWLCRVTCSCTRRHVNLISPIHHSGCMKTALLAFQPLLLLSDLIKTSHILVNCDSSLKQNSREGLSTLLVDAFVTYIQILTSYSRLGFLFDRRSRGSRVQCHALDLLADNCHVHVRRIGSHLHQNTAHVACRRDLLLTACAEVMLYSMTAKEKVS